MLMINEHDKPSSDITDTEMNFYSSNMHITYKEHKRVFDSFESAKEAWDDADNLMDENPTILKHQVDKVLAWACMEMYTNIIESYNEGKIQAVEWNQDVDVTLGEIKVDDILNNKTLDFDKVITYEYSYRK